MSTRPDAPSECTLKDRFGTKPAPTPKPSPMSRRRRAALALDEAATDRGRLHKTIGPDGEPRFWVEGEPMAIAGESLALDEQPKSSRQIVTFDGALPPQSK